MPRKTRASTEIARAGWRHLRAGLRPGARLRTILPVLSVLAAVALGSLALSVGEGLFRAYMIDVNLMGLDIITVNGRRDSPVTSNGIRVEDGQAIQAEIANIRAFSPQAFHYPAFVQRGDVSEETAVRGFVDLGDSLERGPRGFRIALGETITQEDDDNLAQVAVIGSALRESLFAAEADPIGENILIDGIPFRVKGVLGSRVLFPSEPARNRVENIILLVPFSTGAAYLFDSADRVSINVFVEDADRIHETANAIRDLGFRKYGHEAYGVNYPAQFVEEFRKFRARLWGFLATLAGLMLLAGNVSISIIMLMSVRARRREIGIRLAVGARPRDIQWQFAGETLAGGVAGGLLGVLTALASLPLLAWFDIPAEPLPQFFAAPLAIALLASALASIAPARRAAQLAPVEALAPD